MAQLKSTNVTGNLSVTGNILASKIIKIGGTSNQILMANGETTNLSDILGKLNAAVILKGTLGTVADGGTIQTLPTASATVLGHAYKVITAGTYGGITAKIGDMFICYESGTKTYAWMLIPSGDDIEDTWRPIKLEGTQILTNGTSSKPLNFKQGANITIANSDGDLTITAQDTTYGADRGISLSNGNFGHSNTAITAQATKGLYKISYDAYGHITGTESYTDQNTTYSFASGTNCFTVTPSGGSAQTVGVTADRFFRLDTRSANPNPYAEDNYSGYTTVHLKYNNVIGITGEDTYSALMQIYPWGDTSGGAAHQLVYGTNGGIYHRYGKSTWSSWSQLATREWVESLGYIDDVSGYLPLSGSSTTDNSKNMTGPIVFRDVSGIILNSNNKDVKVWSVWGNSGAYAEQYGFHLLYKGTGSGNDNTLHLYAHNQVSTQKEVYEIKQDGTTTWKTAINFTGGATVNGATMVAGPSSATDNAIARFDGTTGQTIQSSGVIIDDDNNLTIPGKVVQGTKNTDTTITNMNQFTSDLYVKGDGSAPNSPKVAGFYLGKSTADENRHMDIVTGSTVSYIDFNRAGTVRDYDFRFRVNNDSGSVLMQWDSSYAASAKLFKIEGGTLEAATIKKTDGADTHVLLAGGGTKAISDFAGSDVGDDYLPLAGGTMNENAVITLPNSAKIVHQTKTTSNYVVDAIWYKGSNAVSSGYDAQIGWHNTGDTDGAITILPHTTSQEPWSSKVGLYISKTRLKYNDTNVSLEGHGHTNMVTGSGLTADKIVVGNGSSTIKTSSKGIVSSITATDDSNVPTSKAVASYVAAQKTSNVYWADQSVATSSSINTEPTFKSIKISDGSTTVKARWTYSATSDCVELVWE